LAGPLTRAGVIRNPLSHANRHVRAQPPAGLLLAEPQTPDALAEALRRFQAEGVDLVIVDGGDGTLREVLTALPGVFGDAAPVLAVLPSGKTNVAAFDLGGRLGLRIDDVLTRAGAPRLAERSVLEVAWTDAARPPVRGMLLGAGGFVRATALSRDVHRLGAFHGLSVALTLAGAVSGTLLGGAGNPWRAGVDIGLGLDEGPAERRARLVVLATTLERLPFGLKPFGAPRAGMKLLDVDAPPRNLLGALGPLLAGRDPPWLARAGYRRAQPDRMRLTLEASVVIDGELFPGGDILVRRGGPVRFLVP
jgi:diacylglycerol kinase (ATP)